MKCSVLGVFALGATLGGAAAMAVAASDPAIRRRMCGKAKCMGRRVVRTAGSWVK